MTMKREAEMAQTSGAQEEEEEEEAVQTLDLTGRFGY